MTENARLQSRRPRYRAVAYVSCDLRSIALASLHSCRLRSEAVAIALHKRNTFTLKQQTKLRYQQNNNMPNFPLGLDHS